jgi:hypothetical protein
MSFSNVGQVWSSLTFEEYIAATPPPKWVKAVCLHHTAVPSLLQRPKGLLMQHIKNIRDFYQAKGWHAGPHLFTDEDQVYGMTPLSEPGVHAVSFNRYAIGIEVLGDYDSEDPTKGRGLECWKTTAAATKALFAWLNLPINNKTLLFHRDDPKTSKTCPGTRITKKWVMDMITAADSTKLEQAKQPLADPPKNLVAVAQYLRDIKGYTDEDIARLLRRDDQGLFLFADKWLEGAHYDATKQETVAPIQELSEVPTKKKGK